MKVATFILLADPQTYWEYITDWNGEYYNLTSLNTALNNISTALYPSNPRIGGISHPGQPIGKPDAVFFAGDLTNYGGHWDFVYTGAKYTNVAVATGGPSLLEFRSFYDPAGTAPETLLTECGPLYFGLGNHDINIDGTADGHQWRGFDHNSSFGTTADYYRYQMWNFLNQMHVGYNRRLGYYNQTVRVPPRFPVPPGNIDADPLGTFVYQSYSFNYVVDLGPLDVYQLHLFGGDSLHGRKSGLDWLKQKLASRARGYSRPFFVVQHLPISMKGSSQDKVPMWDESQRDDLLEVLRPYEKDLLGFGVGHMHRHEVNIVTSAAGVTAQEFMIGAANDRMFGVVRVEEVGAGKVATDIVWGLVEQDTGKIIWDKGWTKITGGEALYVKGVEVVHRTAPVDDYSRDLPYYITEASGQSANVNEGFGNEGIYLKPVFTKTASEAITGFDLKVQKDAIPSLQDMDLADQIGNGAHRYLVLKREPGQPPIRQLFLWRADGKQAPRIGWKLSPDLNKERGGSGLFLEWDLYGNYTLGM
ncbi:hypothetical protein QBC42DRAFT_64119 [Cladorrhinum samala]|uniref:Calcineurin-like phosphoesterase domain-containing protein n=1 Tax=Cladorrhinum samala TaxID=585594 RepID=A0AAV9HUB9_9PEZI|nr:hypothetical protein QBC42DRAFT_64119 [Cladorrhinum samala]